MIANRSFLFHRSSNIAATPILQSKYESPHIIDTDEGKKILCWPNASGRDGKVSIKGEFVSVEIQLAPLKYSFFNLALSLNLNFYFVFLTQLIS